MNVFKQHTRTLLCAVGIFAGALLSACGGGGDPILGVPSQPLVSVAVTPAPSTVAMGLTTQLVATATYGDGTTRVVTTESAWVSGNTTIATVGAATGLARGVTLGTTTMTATFGGKSGVSNLTVTAPTLVSISIAPLAPSVQIGATRQMFVTARYSDASVVNVSNTSTYVSATPSVATVGASTGMVSGVSAGSSLVTATFGGMTASTTVTVPAATITAIAVTPAASSVAVGATRQFTATATYSDASTGNVTNSAVWSSNNMPVATVAAGGMATGVSAGVANITATVGANSGFGVLTVTAVAPPPVATINLGAADSFAVLAGTSLTNNAGGITLVSGDVGAPSQTTDPVQTLGWNNYKSGAPLTNALAALETAITQANALPCDTNSAAGINLGGQVFTPGVYCYAGAISLTGTFTMNGPGRYVFRTASTLNTTAGSQVVLLGGASADNVFWVPVGATTTGANSVFQGTVMARSAAITLGDMTTLINGRVLSAAAVTLQNNVITK
jgi:uncharacterized protein YjdB